MPLLVTCSCGRKFQAKEEHAGLQAKCPQCGQLLVIQGLLIEPTGQPAQQFVPNRAPQSDLEAVSPDEALSALKAATVLEAREAQAQADAQFTKKMLIIAGVVILLGGIGFAVMRSPKESSVAKADPETKKTPPPAPPAQPKEAAVTAPVAPPAPDPKTQPAPTPPTPPTPPAPPQFDKSVLGRNDPKRVKFSGPVVTGMTEDGGMIVHLNTETLPSGSTSTYRAKLKLRQALGTPIPKGIGVTFEATTTPGMTQTTDFSQNADGTRRVDAIYTATFVDAVILSTDEATIVAVPPTQEAPPALPAPKNDPTPTQPKAPSRAINTGPPKDDVDRYLLSAIMSKDGHARMNALMFSPDDPRFNFEFVDRKLPLNALDLIHAKLEVLEKPEDLETGPVPTDATDQIEARMLMDEQVVGSGIWLDGRAAKDKFFVFLDPCKLSMPDVIKRYGQPTKSTNSGQSTINFYGRMALVVFGGKVHAVARRVTKAGQ